MDIMTFRNVMMSCSIIAILCRITTSVNTQTHIDILIVLCSRTIGCKILKCVTHSRAPDLTPFRKDFSLAEWDYTKFEVHRLRSCEWQCPPTFDAPSRRVPGISCDRQTDTDTGPSRGKNNLTHLDQLRAQRLVTSMGKLLLLLLYITHC